VSEQDEAAAQEPAGQARDDRLTGEARAQEPAGEAGDDRLTEIAHGGLRGTMGAMAMTGMRSFTVSLGLVEEPPPRAILRQKSKGLFRVVPKRFRRAGQELFHCV